MGKLSKGSEIAADKAYVTFHDVHRAASLGETGVEAVLGALKIEKTRGYFTFHDVQRAETLAINSIAEKVIDRQADPATAPVIHEVPEFLYDRFVSEVSEGVA